MEFKTQAEYFGRMMETLRQRSGVRLGEHSEPALRLRALASELEGLGAAADWIWRQSFPQTAEGDQLDALATVRGLTRRPGAKAVGSVSFVTDGGDAVAVPEGTVVMTADLRRFVTTEELVIPAGTDYGEAPAMAEEEGVAGNVAAEEIVLMAYPPVGVVDCLNVEAFSGGEERESDDELRRRLADAYRLLGSFGGEAYYRMLALSVPGVTACTVRPMQNGRGTVGVCIAGTRTNGTATDEVKQAVLDLINAQREMCVTVTMINPSTATCNLNYTAYVRPGADRVRIKADAIARIKPLFGAHTLGQTVYNHDVVDAIQSVEGVLGAQSTYSASDWAANLTKIYNFGNLSLQFREV